MPVVVGEGHRCAVGTAVDYAHHAFQQVRFSSPLYPTFQIGPNLIYHLKQL